ncbi:MAG: D-glycero-alpha-D-manno-heptose-1,7-bisphosphate 7-phosphatase [Alphaproteobacteria bacterium]
MSAAYPLDEHGVWCELLRPREGGARPAIFLDRDGTLIELVDYLSRPEQVRLIVPALALVRAANALDLLVVVITNQSGIGRGYYGWDAFAAVQARLLALLAEEGCSVDAVMACPALPDSGAPCRKPNPGMLLDAARLLPLDLQASWIVGDSLIDLQAGKRAGLRRGWLAPTGYGPRDAEAARALLDAGFDAVLLEPLDLLAARLRQAVS